MELKTSLQDYTEPEFLSFVQKIWAVDVHKQDHDRLINHFDRIVDHPKGADLLFYPDSKFNVHSADFVVYYVKDWHARRGTAAFKGGTAPGPVPTRPAALSARERALKSSNENLAKVQKLAADISFAEQAVESAFAQFDQLLGAWGKTPAPGIDELERKISSLEAAQQDASMTASTFEFLKMHIQFARDDAQRSLGHSLLDAPLQQTVFQHVTRSHDRYIAQLPVFAQRHRDLQTRVETVLDTAEEQLVRMRSQAGTGPTRTSTSASAPAAFANAWPYVLLNGASALERRQVVDLQKSIRSAVAEFTWLITAGTEEHKGQYAAVLRFDFSSRVADQRFGLGVPLSQLLQIEGQDWQALAATKAEVDVAFRMSTGIVATKPGTKFRGLKEVQELAQVYITPTNGNALTSKVRVRAAIRDEHLNRYSFTSDGSAPTTVSWTPPIALENTTPVELNLPNRMGFIETPPLPLLEPFVAIEEVQFDDYIVVFPADCGLDPVYVMFKDRRGYPGVVSGNGQAVAEDWLVKASTDDGAPIPSSIAEQLRGRLFNRFDTFKTAFWKAVSATPELNAQFNVTNQALMVSGQPPLNEQEEGERILLISHQLDFTEGGEVYDVDNLIVWC
jgi:hypothetical protein